MEKEIVISPIFYMGNKARLIKNGLLDLFPEDIDVFVEPFCGSGVVSMNTNANSFILNDYNKTIVDLLRFFKTHSAAEIIEDMSAIIKQHNLLKGFNKRSLAETEEYKEKAKNNYNKFREYYNTIDNSIINLYILSYYCNNNNIRFNSSGKFNMPIGNQYFKLETHSKKIIDSCNFFNKENVYLYNKSYADCNYNILDSNDFVYFDPPYSNTLAIYNEQQGWSIQDDYNLFALCEKLTARGIRWGMSNVFENKGNVNEHLIDWVNKNGYNVHFFDGFNYVSCGKGNAKTVEVFISNY